MKQFLLAAVLIAVPVGLFASYEHYLAPLASEAQGAPQKKGLGDLSNFRTITADVRKLADGGDMAGAEKRATDFETAWDDAEASLRPMDPEAWGNVDAAADHLFKSLRSGKPVVTEVDHALDGLQTALDGSSAQHATDGGQTLVHGIPTTDANGHAIPCEDLIGKLKQAVAKPDNPAADKTKADALLAKALERCNADDDTAANGFSAEGLALLSK